MRRTLGGSFGLAESRRVGEEDLDAQPQGLGDLLGAALGDQLPELDLEVGGLQARWALLEVVAELGLAFRRELAVEEVLELVQEVVAVLVGHHVSWAMRCCSTTKS